MGFEPVHKAGKTFHKLVFLSITSFSIPIICVLMGLARDRHQLSLSLSIFSILVENSYFMHKQLDHNFPNDEYPTTRRPATPNLANRQ